MSSIASRISAIALGFAAVASQPVIAGPVFLTGHDPDFHAQDSVHAAYPEKDAWFTECSGGAWAPVFGDTFDRYPPRQKKGGNPTIPAIRLLHKAEHMHASHRFTRRDATRNGRRRYRVRCR